MKRPVYMTMLPLTEKHLAADPLEGIASSAARIERLEERVARAIAALDALQRSLARHSFTSEDPRTRALLMSTLLCAEAAHVEWTRLGGGATARDEAYWIEELMNYAFTQPKRAVANLSRSVWGLGLTKTASQQAFRTAAEEVLRALISHSPRFVDLDVDVVEQGLRDWQAGPRRRGGPRKGTRPNIRIIHELLVAAGITGGEVRSSGRTLRYGRAGKKK